jgi:hypothetical protein
MTSNQAVNRRPPAAELHGVSDSLLLNLHDYSRDVLSASSVASSFLFQELDVSKPALEVRSLNRFSIYS